MELRPGRVRGMVDESIEKDSFIPCHQTLYEGEQAVCRGFYDRHGERTLGCRLGMLYGVIEVDPGTSHRMETPAPDTTPDPEPTTPEQPPQPGEQPEPQQPEPEQPQQPTETPAGDPEAQPG